MAYKVLITGSCGFIFSNFVIYALQETDWDLVSVDKLTYAGSIRNVPQVKRHKLHIGDICDSHFVNRVFENEKPDIVIHGAAESHVDNSIKDASEFIQTNVVGTHVLLDAALKYGRLKKFINVSTDEVYGQIASGSFKEESKLTPRNPYAASKAAADLLGHSYYQTFRLPVITTRCSNVFGPRQHQEKFIPKSILNALAGEKIPVYGEGKNIRDWLYVKDKFYALKLLVENGIPGEVYNISAGQEELNIDILNMILDELGKSKNLIEFVKDRPGHDLRYSIDSTKLQQLGWKPQYKLREALKHTCGWYTVNKWFYRS